MVSGDVKGPGICSRDNRRLKLDLFSKEKQKGVLISAMLGREGEAQNLVWVTIAGSYRSYGTNPEGRSVAGLNKGVHERQPRGFSSGSRQ